MSMEINKIYCGNAYELIKQIPDKSVDLIYTDPPYLIRTGGVGNSEVSKRIQRLNHCDLADIRQGIDYSILDEFCRVLKHIYIYIWCSKEQIYDYMTYFVKEHNCFFDILFWGKTNPTPASNNLFLNNVEYLLVFREKGTYFSKQYELKSKYFISALNKDDKDLYAHPTIKPLELVKKHILNSSRENDLILDPFVGSGTTCVACKELGRKYLGFEISDNYYKIACDRINGITKSGQTSLLDTDFEQLDLFGEE